MKKVYNGIIKLFHRIILKIEILKTWTAEWVAILKKWPLYRNVKWSKEQKEAFDNFWKKNYGRRIPNYWHRLYEASNGVFNLEYLPEIIYSTKIEPKINDSTYCKVFSDKNLIGLFFGDRIDGVRTPKSFLANINGCFYDGDKHLISKEKALEFFSNIGIAVVKPTVDSSSGKNVMIVDMQNGINVRNGDSAAELINSYKSNFVVQEKIVCCEELSKLYSKSVNTIRVISYVAKNKIEVAPLSLRIGGGGSEVDNIHAGGMSIAVSNDGQLANKAYRLGYGNSFENFESHPDTGVVFSGYKLSFAEKLVSVAKRLHEMTANIGVVSWDFTVDENGEIVVIEVNLKGQSVWFPQMLSGESLLGENTSDILKMIRG